MADPNSPDNPNRFKFRAYTPKEGRGARTLSLLVRGIVILLLIILAILIIRQINHYFFVDKPTPALPTPTSQTSTTPNKTTTPPKKTTNSTSPSNLPNNGPGDTAAIFAGVSLLAAGVHLAAQARRQAAKQ